MANVSRIKAVRTRYRNTLNIEIEMAKGLIYGESQESDPIALGNKCTKLLKCYSEKLEVQMCKLTDAFEDSDPESVEKIVDEDCELIQHAENCLIELEQFIENMKAKTKDESLDGNNLEVKTESSRLIDLQEQMQQLVFRQMQQQRELMERQEQKELQQKCSVKLPKLDLYTFNGNKLKWTQFWDAFECTVHANRNLSQIEKFNYLQTKVVGEARQAIAGLALSKENYDVAVAILKERFGNPQEAVDLHYKKLINIQAPSAKVESLRTFLDTAERHLRSLEVLNENINQHVFISIIRSKLPGEVLKQIELRTGAKTQWTVHKLRDEIREYVLACERSESKGENTTSTESHRGSMSKFQRHQYRSNYIAYPPQRSERPFYTPPASAEALTASVKGRATSIIKDKCRYCSERHWSDECVRYKTVDERKRKLYGSCFKCLKEGHMATECRSKKACVYCSEMNSHHRSLCPKKFDIKLSSVHLSKEISDKTTKQGFLEEGHVLISSDEMVLMQTAQTDVRNEDSSACETVRLLFDSGSQRTYITERLAAKLGLKPEDEQELKLVTFGSENTKVIKTKSARIGIKLNNGSYMKITVNIVPTISGTIQRNPVTKLLTKQMEHLVNSVELADTIPTVKEHSTVEVLIGNDYYLDFVLPQRIEVEPGLYLLSSKLGWILTGRTSEVLKGIDTVNMLVLTYGNDVTNNSVFSSVDGAISTKPDLEDFWNVESIGITDNVKKSNDEIAMQKFKDTIKFEDGRYEVTWPWRDEEFELPENRQLALGRLKSTISRMNSQPELKKKYNAVIEDQLNKGVIEKVNYKVQDGMTHYIPHHAVINPQKTTTKLRVVYDASSKTRKENKSLNECLYRGPVILQHLCGILLRFRLHKIAIVSDIEKAFLQIGLQLDQRDVTRFLWLKDIDTPTVDSSNIQEYRFCRVPFGVISSPFLLGATVQNHMDTYNTDLSNKVKDNMYVDNLITGTSNESEAIHFYKEVKFMFKEASMNLREWISNSDIVNNYIPRDDRADAGSISVLGLCWNPMDDTISLKSTEASDIVIPTKRSILKNVASKFDPIGLFSPVLLSGKLLLQKLWQLGLDWDEEIPEEDVLQWNAIKSDLEKLSSYKLQRCVTRDGDSCVNYSLICFCDASEKAYSATIYLRQSSTVETKVELVFSKSRLAPVKTLTIPKLEIMAVLIGVRCIKFVQCQLKLTVQHLHLYTDSQCVLKWISSEKDLQVFVKNRVNEIKTHRDVTFSYVKTKENPADVATRGTTLQKLAENELWWHGPSWLSVSCSKYPSDIVSEMCTSSTCACTEIEQMQGEEMKGATSVLTPNLETIVPFEIDYGSYSSITKLIRVTAYVRRFIYNLKKHADKNTGVLSNSEINESENMWLLFIQRKHYSDVRLAISNNKSNCLQRQLGLFLDDKGLLRCRGRLQYAELSEGSRYPILVPKKDKFTHLLVEKHHKEIMHCGVSQTLSKLRYKYWIPQGRATVKSVLRQCNVCRRCEGGPYKVPEMPPFPKMRVTSSPPFTNTGLDYLGPLFIKSPVETKKIWVCLFTCLVTRAIHLELVQDMSTDEFLLAFRRFISQRGVPNEVISDNALQFKTASATIDLLWTRMLKNEDVLSYMSEKKIKWHFIVERAPWFGGCYERLVGLVKRSLRKTLGRKLLTLIQMTTVLKEIEAILNSRPLVYVGDDINSNITLTPNHFLTLNPRVSVPDIDDDGGDNSYLPWASSADKLLVMWHKGQLLLDKFWKIWRDDYLLSLRERTQTKLKTGRIQSSAQPCEGDVILVKDELPRSCWKMGKINKLGICSDGNVRSAEVQLASGRVIRRPLKFLFPIETSEQHEMNHEMNSEQTGPTKCDSPRPVRKAAIRALQKMKELN